VNVYFNFGNFLEALNAARPKHAYMRHLGHPPTMVQPNLI